MEKELKLMSVKVHKNIHAQVIELIDRHLFKSTREFMNFAATFTILEIKRHGLTQRPEIESSLEKIVIDDRVRKTEAFKSGGPVNKHTRNIEELAKYLHARNPRGGEWEELGNNGRSHWRKKARELLK